MKYKLYQLLKLRKKLVSELNKLKERFNDNNSILVGGIRNYEPSEIYDEIIKIKEKIIKLKIAIQQNTLPIYDKIHRMEEYKDLILLLKSTSTNNGTVENTRYGDNSLLNYSAVYTKDMIDKIITDYEQKIDQLQDEIDQYNYTTEVELDI